MFTFIITLIFGIIIGLFLATIILFYLIKSKCPSCKKLKPLKEIILFQWKQRTITGQPCHQCQKPKPQVSIEL